VARAFLDQAYALLDHWRLSVTPTAVAADPAAHALR